MVWDVRIQGQGDMGLHTGPLYTRRGLEGKIDSRAHTEEKYDHSSS